VRKTKKDDVTLSRPRRRLRSEDRRKQILEGAISFFAEHGFEGGTRDLAKTIGVTQPLIYNYFPTKNDLIRQVYQSVYVDRWKGNWLDLIGDRSINLRSRLLDFYISYTQVIFSPDWLRIYLFSGLRGLEINSMWISFVEDHLIQRVCNEIRRDNGLPTSDLFAITPKEVEAFWIFHSGIFYYGVRLQIYKSPVHLALGPFLETSVLAMLTALPVIMRECVSGSDGTTPHETDRCRD
jgi:AcrR family transcriptional regulator